MHPARKAWILVLALVVPSPGLLAGPPAPATAPAAPASPASPPAPAVREEPARGGSSRLSVKEVTVFKDGHAFVLEEGVMPVDESGSVVLDRLPAPVLGTFWPFAAAGGP